MEVVERSNNKCNVIYRPHPIFTGRDCQHFSVNEGDTVRELLVKAGVDQKQPIVISLDDRLLKVGEWDLICPQAGQIINVKATVMGGGGGGGSNPVQTVAMVALIITAAALAAPTGGASLYLAGAMGISATTASAMVMTGIMIAGSMLINSVFAANAPSSSMGELSGQYAGASPTYSLSGGGNRMRPYESMPVIFGQIQIFPDLAARAYTEYQGSDQYLYQIFHFGLSDADFSDFRIGTSSLSDYTDVTWKLPDSSGKIPNFPGNVDSIAGVELTHALGWATRTTSQNTFRIGIDIESVLYYANNAGGLDATSVGIRVQIKKTSESAWSDPAISCAASGVSVSGGSVTLTGRSQTPIRATLLIDVPSGEYDVRLIRDTADASDARLQNKTSWSTLRSYQEDSATYEAQHRRGLIIKATSQLNGAIQQLSCKATAKATYWDGANWVTSATRNPAHWFMDFAVGKRKLDGKLIYGAGRSRASLDLDGLHAWAQFCDAEGLTFDAVLDGSQTVQDFLNTIARCGFGSMTLANGKLGVIWDGRNTPVSAAYGMSNIIAGSFEVTYLTENLAEEIIVRYSNPDKDFIQDEVRAIVPGVENPTRTSSVDLYGCANKAMAGKFANYLAAQQKYRTRRIKWDCDFEGFSSQRGDVVILSHDLTQWGYSGRIVSTSSVANEYVQDGYVQDGYAQDGYVQDDHVSSNGVRFVHLDRPVPRNGSREFLMVKSPDGSMKTYEVVCACGQSDVLELTADLIVQDGFLEMDHLWFFSPISTPGKKVKILSSEPISESRIQIIATDEYPQFYDAWNGAFLEPRSDTRLLPQQPIEIVNLSILMRTAISNGYTVNRAVISWRNLGGTNYCLVRVYINGNRIKEIAQCYETSLEIDISDPGILLVEVVPHGAKGIGRVLSQSISLPSLDFPPPPTSLTLLLGVNGRSATLEWPPVAGAVSYVIEIWSGGAIKRNVNVGNTQSYIYSVDESTADGGPFRSYEARVRSVSAGGQSVGHASAIFNNSQIGQLQNVSIDPLPSSIFINYSKPADADFAGVMVWLSTDSFFTPSNATLVYDGADTWVTINADGNGLNLAPDTNYYVYIAGYDLFGKDKLTLSSKLTARVLSTAAGLSPGDISSQYIADAAISTAKIQDAAISSAKIANAAIKSAQIGDLVVGTIHVKDGAVTQTLYSNYSRAITVLNTLPDQYAQYFGYESYDIGVWPKSYKGLRQKNHTIAPVKPAIHYLTSVIKNEENSRLLITVSNRINSGMMSLSPGPVLSYAHQYMYRICRYSTDSSINGWTVVAEMEVEPYQFLPYTPVMMQVVDDGIVGQTGTFAYFLHVDVRNAPYKDLGLTMPDGGMVIQNYKK